MSTKPAIPLEACPIGVKCFAPRFPSKETLVALHIPKACDKHSAETIRETNNMLIYNVMFLIIA
jgi:hypothetical protein